MPLRDCPVADVYTALRADDLGDLYEVLLDEPAWRLPDGSVLVTQHAAVSEVLTADGISSRQRPEADADSVLDTDVLMALDPPMHTVVRQALARSVSLRPTAAAARVAELLDAAPADLVEDVIAPLELWMAGQVIGLPLDTRPQLHTWTRQVGDQLDPLRPPDPSAGPVTVQLLACVLRLLEATEPGGMAAALVAARDRGLLDERHVLTNLVHFLSAAVDTTQGLLSSCAMTLARHPDLVEALRDDASLHPRFIEEVCRLEPPAQLIWRRAAAPRRLGGVELDRDTGLALALGCANRDPRVFERHAEVVLARRPVGHVGFGAGIHRCVGMGVARVLAKAFVEQLLARWDRFGIVTGAAIRRPHTVFRAYDAVPLASR